VVANAFNGAGDTWTPTLINFGCFWIFEIPLAYTLARPLGVGASGVFIAVAAAFSLHAVIAVLVFRRGHLEAKKV
jgi:Na+-driven multidrug efflux pump